jgi:hypothetical protein
VTGRVLAALALAASFTVPAQDAQIHGRQDVREEVEVWPMESTGEVSMVVVRERYRIYTDHCARELPALKSAFVEVMNSLQGRIRSIGLRLLESEAFSDMKQQQVSSTLRSALSAELAAVRLELEDQDPELVCAGTLQGYRGTTDALLEDFLKRTLAGIRSTARTLKDTNAP